MTRSPLELTVFIDFLCPFAYRASQWFDLLEEQRPNALAIRWRYFSLEQINTPADMDWRIWEQPADYAGRPGSSPNHRALHAFWAAEAARRQGDAAFNTFRSALFHARHRDKIDFSDQAAIAAVARSAGLDMDRFATDSTDRSALDALCRDHEDSRAMYQAFGVPTICFDAQHAIYLKLAEVPPAEAAWPFFDDAHRDFAQRLDA
ncbi:MAG TPA: DsbA family protein, partial [Roseiflexaceae bacterium]|nr:DsbA family protein [Roseiflexaceae bacterium]